MMAVAQLKESVSGIFIAPRSVGAQLARNTFWSMAGAGLSQSSSLVAALVMGRVLGVKQFGQLALIQATVILLGNLGEMGFSLTTTKFVSRWRLADPVRAGKILGHTLRNTLICAVAIAFLLGEVGPRVALFGLLGLGPELWAACGLLIFDMVNRIQLGALSGLEDFESVARVQVVRGVLMLPCVWAGAVWGGLVGAILGLSIVSLGTCAAGHITLHKRCREASIPIRFGRSTGLNIWGTSFSLWGGSLLLALSTWGATLMLARHAAGVSELGLYNAADKWKTALTFLPQMLFQVTLPMLSHRQAAGDRQGCKRIVRMALASTIAITGSGALVLTWIARPLMTLYGNGFIAGTTVLPLSALSAVAGSIYTVGAGALWALGKPAQMLGVDLFKTSLLLGLCAFGLASNARNLALAYFLTFSAGSIVLLLALRRQLGKQHE